ncbi:MAG: ABC transporter substrate-binding protein, partial [Candidatus Adiutrix sp.]
MLKVLPCLALLLGLMLFSNGVRAETHLPPIEVVSWAPNSGAQALWHDALEGLKVSLAMYNANGGINGRLMELSHFVGDENNPDFMAQLARQAENLSVVAVVGGPAQQRSQYLAEYFQRIGRLWFGPWSQEADLYDGPEPHPFAVLPSWREELPALLTYMRLYFDSAPQKEGPIYLFYYSTLSSQKMAEYASLVAGHLKLDLRRAPLALDFNDWQYLAQYAGEAKGAIVWLPHGPAAALVRAMKVAVPQAVYMTSGL